MSGVLAVGLWFYVVAYAVLQRTELLFAPAVAAYVHGRLSWERLVGVLLWRTALSPVVLLVDMTARVYRLLVVIRHLREPEQLFLRKMVEAGYPRGAAVEMLMIRNGLVSEYGARG